MIPSGSWKLTVLTPQGRSIGPLRMAMSKALSSSAALSISSHFKVKTVLVLALESVAGAMSSSAWLSLRMLIMVPPALNTVETSSL